MKNQELLLLIKGKDESDKAFKSAQENMRATEKTASNLGGGIASLKSNWLAVTAATAGFVAIAKQAIDEFMKQEEAEHALAGAMLNVGDYTKAAHAELVRYAEQLQKTTVFADDVTLATMANLKAYGMNNEQLKAATQATLDLASAKRMDLWAASELVGKAFVGETGTLARYGIVIDDNISRGEKFAAVLQTINERFGGRAAMEIETYSGQWKVLKNVWGDILENVGYALLKVLEAVTGALGTIVEGWSRLTSAAAGAASQLLTVMATVADFTKSKNAETLHFLAESASDTSKRWNEIANSWSAFSMQHFGMIAKGQKDIDEAMNSRIKKVHILTEEEKKALEDYQKADADVHDKIMQAALDETEYKLTQLHTWYLATIDTYTKAGKETSEIWQAYEAQRGKIIEDGKKKDKDGFDFMTETAKEAAKNMQDAFSDFFFDAMTGKFKSFGDTLKGFFNSLARSLSNMLAKQLTDSLFGKQFGSSGEIGGILGSLAKGLGSWVSGLLGSSSYSWGGEAQGFAQGGVIAGGFRPLPFRAMQEGYVVDRPTMGLIGEGGSPEAVIPLSGGSVPVRIMGGTGANIQVNIVNKGSEKKATVGGAVFDGRKYVIGVILEDLDRGGPLRSAFSSMK